MARCPNPAHDDSEPSWSIVDRPGDRRHGSHHCFSCKWGGGPWELAAAVWGVTVEEAGKRIAKLGLGPKPPTVDDVPKVVVRNVQPAARPFGLPLGVEVPGREGRWYEPALDYLVDRGVTREQADRWGAGYALRGRLRHRVVFPVRDSDGALLTFSARAFSPAARGGRYETGRVRDGARPRRALWGEEGWRDRAAVTVAEGIFSALALERAGAPNPCALLGSELTPEKARVLRGCGLVLVATDPDAAGEKVAGALSVLARHTRLVRVRLRSSPDDASLGELVEALSAALKESA